MHRCLFTFILCVLLVGCGGSPQPAGPATAASMLGAWHGELNNLPFSANITSSGTDTAGTLLWTGTYTWQVGAGDCAAAGTVTGSATGGNLTGALLDGCEGISMYGTVDSQTWSGTAWRQNVPMTYTLRKG
jgi:hypothetical protein